MKKTNAERRLLSLFLFTLASIDCTASPVASDWILADPAACEVPALPPPAPIKDSERRYGFQRRFIDLDGSGTCVLMDVWVERLDGSDSPGMRTLAHRFMHAVGRKWVPFDTDLALFPLMLRSPSTKQTYLVVVPDDGIDDIVGAGVAPAAYVRGGWHADGPGVGHRYSLEPVTRGAGDLYRAVAAALAKRHSPGLPSSADRQRIQALTMAASDADALDAQATKR